jgi:hypothetical protein
MQELDRQEAAARADLDWLKHQQRVVTWAARWGHMLVPLLPDVRRLLACHTRTRTPRYPPTHTPGQAHSHSRTLIDHLLRYHPLAARMFPGSSAFLAGQRLRHLSHDVNSTSGDVPVSQDTPLSPGGERGVFWVCCGRCARCANSVCTCVCVRVRCMHAVCSLCARVPRPVCGALFDHFSWNTHSVPTPSTIATEHLSTW